MSTVDGKNVIGSGVIHFHDRAEAHITGGPQLGFVAQPGVANGFAVRGTPSGIEITFDLAVGASLNGTPTFTLNGARYAVSYVLIRLTDLPNGVKFYSASYTLFDD